MKSDEKAFSSGTQCIYGKTHFFDSAVEMANEVKEHLENVIKKIHGENCDGSCSSPEYCHCMESQSCPNKCLRHYPSCGGPTRLWSVDSIPCTMMSSIGWMTPYKCYYNNDFEEMWVTIVEMEF